VRTRFPTSDCVGSGVNERIQGNAHFQPRLAPISGVLEESSPTRTLHSFWGNFRVGGNTPATPRGVNTDQLFRLTGRIVRCVPLCIRLDIFFPLRWCVFCEKDRGYRASRDTRATANTIVRINVELRRFSKPCFVSSRMNAIHWTNIDAGCVFYSDARRTDYVGHDSSSCFYLKIGVHATATQ
jgi:hypothetical protein